MTSNKYNHRGWTPRTNRRRHFGLSREFRNTFIKNAILFGIVAIFAGSLCVLGIMAFVSRDLPNPNSLTQRAVSQTTKIYDRTGIHLLYEIFGEENRTLKKLQKGFCEENADIETDTNGIPLFAIQATIAAEDRNYCEHGGFDLKGFLRAIVQNIFGNRVGGSTLTQQLVKNAILSNEKTMTRKIKELILSLELERRYSKDEILQIYFNEIPYGSTFYGIEAASQNYFGIPVNELTLAQAATLAAMPKAPTTYLNNPDRLQARRDYILEEMSELGFITQEEHNTALAEISAINIAVTNISAPHFVFFVREQLEEKYGQNIVEKGGLKVITTLNYDMQNIAEEEVKNGVDNNRERYGLTNAALVAIDPKTGQILSMVGSKDFFDTEIDGQVNVTTRLRQPGSSFKPIVYAKAFDMGYTPNTVLWDVKTTFPTVTGNYSPNNYDGKEHGPIRVRDALQMSLNIPAVKMINLVGVETTLDFATSLGYTSFWDHSAFGPSLVLGGGEVKLLEHTNAYATFANEGSRNESVSVLKVEDAEGNTLEQWKAKEGKRVMDKNVARTISNVLSDNNARAPIFGANSYLQLGDRPSAAKTGTTNNYIDGWLMGYTPSLAVGVWVGNNDNTPMNKAGGSIGAGPIWNGFMKRALEGTPIESFGTPEINMTGKAVLDGSISSSNIIIDRASGKLATQYTPASFREERTYAQYHSILHYCDPKDPTGAVPEHPEGNPQYSAWEAGIQTWIQIKQEETGIKILDASPPTQEDDLHVPENFPNVRISTPQNNEDLNNHNITIEVDAEAVRALSRVEFYIDGQYLGTDKRKPFAFSTSIPSSINRGIHTLKAIAYDDIDNAGSDTVAIQLNSNANAEIFELIDPKNGQTIERINDYYSVIVSIIDPEKFRSVAVYALSMMNGDEERIGEIQNPSSPFLTFDWKIPGSGRWAIYAKATPNDGDKLSTAGILVDIKDKVPETGGNTDSEVHTPTDPLLPFSLPQ